MRTGNNLEQVLVVLSSQFFAKSFRGMCVLSCSQFSVFFCEKFFVGCMFSVVLSSQFFCEKFFVRSVFLVVLSSQFPVPSIFALGTLGTRNKKIRFILKNTFDKKND